MVYAFDANLTHQQKEGHKQFQRELKAFKKLLVPKKMSQYRRFFAQKEERQQDKILLKSQYNHMAKVLRTKAGEHVIVCFDDGIEHFCVVENIDSDTVFLKILSSNACQNENSFSTTLFLGAMKNEKNQLVIQKSVELGVNKIVFFDSKFCVAKFDKNKISRFNAISLEASKQCGRAVVVPVDYLPINSLAKQFSNFHKVIFCNEQENSTSLADVLNSIKHSANQNDTQKNIAIIVGSEGGFSADEAAYLTQNGAVSVTLGKRILRAETVPICLLSILNFTLNKN